MRKVTRKDNRFSITEDKAKRTWGTFYVTQPLGGRACLTTTLGPSHTPPHRLHVDISGKILGTFQKPKETKELSYKTGPAGKKKKKADTRGRHLCKSQPKNQSHTFFEPLLSICQALPLTFGLDLSC